MATTFHELRVRDVAQLTDDSAAVTFDVPPALAGRFAFAPGQSLTIRRGGDRRSYSICAARGRAPRIGVREVAGGAVSGWLVHEVRAGELELDHLADPDLADPVEAKHAEGVAHRLALRVEDAGLQGDVDAGFHQLTSFGPTWVRPLVRGITPRRLATSV